MGEFGKRFPDQLLMARAAGVEQVNEFDLARGTRADRPRLPLHLQLCYK